MGETRKQFGFTLIELLVTIAVLAVIAMMAAPSFGQLMQVRQLDMMTRELSFLLSDVRSKATVLRTNTKLVFSAGQNTATSYYWLPKYEGITLDSRASDVDFSDVVFTPIGQPKQRKKLIDNPTPGGTPAKLEVILPLKFTLCNPKIKQSRTISLSINGTVSDIAKGVC